MTYDLNDHISGDTFEGAQYTVTVGGNPLDLTSAKITAFFRQKFGQRLVETLSTGDSQIEITDAAAGEFQIKKQVIAFDAGDYEYQIEIRLANGDVKTYIKGEWTIAENYG